MIWRCHSPVNGILPRHAVLRYRGQWIDSTVREWRASPAPHKKRWPVGLPVVVGLLKLFGLAGPIYADPQCLALPQFIDGLAEKYAETPRQSRNSPRTALLVRALIGMSPNSASMAGSRRLYPARVASDSEVN